MKVMITGGSGFIGTHTTAKLKEQGHEVTLFDRVAKKDIGSDNFCIGDIRDREAVMEACMKHDAVINLAGILGTMETIDNPHPSIDTNIHGALNVFEGCKPNKVLTKGVKCVQIAVGNYFMNNTYSISKTTAERFAMMFNKEHNCEISVVRGLNAYGEGQKHKPIRKITPNFIVRALTNTPIEVYGDGSQIMDMIYVGDLAEILIRAITKDHGVYDSVFSAGTGRRTSVLEIANLINQISGNKAGIKHLPMRSGEPEKSIVIGDPKTLEPLGIKPDDLVKLEDGLEKTIKWYKDNYKLEL